jgi:SAM-dependent methyltransferase
VAGRVSSGTNRLYGDLAWLWPVISSPDEYEREARDWKRILRRELGPGRKRLLELGCGGGHFTSRLARDHDIVAVDLSPEMIVHSRRLNPGVRHVRGDMRSVRLGIAFDAVLIHDAAAYLRTASDLRRALSTARAHIRPGGLLMVAPEWIKDHFPGTWSRHFEAENNGTRVAFFEHEFDPDPEDTTMRSMIIYVIRRGGRVRVEQDSHKTGLFSIDEWRKAFARSGFAMERVPTRHGEDPRQPYLLVGMRSRPGD